MIIDDKEFLMYLYYAAATVGATIVRYYWKSNEKKEPTVFSPRVVVKELSVSTIGAFFALSIIPNELAHDKVIAVMCLSVLLSEDIINLIFSLGPKILYKIVNEKLGNGVNHAQNTTTPPPKDEESDKKGH